MNLQPERGTDAAEQLQPYDATYYEANRQAGDRPALTWYVRLMRRYVGSPPYLDFGCGTGHMLRRLAEIGRAEGFEVSQYSADASRSTAVRCRVHTSLGEIPSDSFNALCAIHVLEHLDDKSVDEVLTCWRRVLVPGGRALVVMPDPGGRGHALAGASWNGLRDPTHINLKPHAEWREFLNSRGFLVLEEGSDGLWDVPYGRLPRLVEACRYAIPSLVQFLTGRLFLRPGSGESCVFVVENRPDLVDVSTTPSQ